jgi:hypothetical protein
MRRKELMPEIASIMPQLTHRCYFLEQDVRAPEFGENRREVVTPEVTSEASTNLAISRDQVEAQ